MIDRASADLLEVVCRLRLLGVCEDVGTSNSIPTMNLTHVFDRIFSIFIDEIYRRYRPLPVMLGDGCAIDCFRLYLAVQGRGGFESVTRTAAWSFVAEDVGLHSDVGTSVKLVYVKYLEPWERWLKMVLEKKNASDGKGALESKGFEGTPKKEQFLSPMKGSQHNLMLHDAVDNGNEVMIIGSSDSLKRKRDEVSDGDGDLAVNLGYTPSVDVEPSQGLSSKKEKFLSPAKGTCQSLVLDSGNEDDEVVILESNVESRRSCYLKRKNEKLVGLLNWIKRLAKSPGDPYIRKVLADGAEGKANAFRMLYSQAFLAREKMFSMKIPRAISDNFFEKNQLKVIASVYDNDVDSQSGKDGKKRFSNRLHAARSQYHSDPEPFKVSRSVVDDNAVVNLGAQAKQGNKKVDDSNFLMDIIAGMLCRNQTRHEVRVGTPFQAEIPEWTDISPVAYNDSDSTKWLGTKVWPLENQDCKQPLRCKPVGRGKELKCECESPDSVDCVRFHVVEERLRLKRELISAFYTWRFDRMGEEISLSWSEGEEQRFKAIMHPNPSSSDDVWEQLRSSFPSKGTKKLISYYFNVYLLRRRSYQNRMTPYYIDSDDEETEFGFLSNSLCHDRIRSTATKFIFCAQNKQCLELDDHGSYGQ